MCEWNVDGPMVRSVAAKVMPTVEPTLGFFYAAPVWSDRDSSRKRYHLVATGMQTRITTVHGTGPARAILIRLKPEAAPLFFASALHELRDTDVELRDLFSNSRVTSLTEQLVGAEGTRQRVSLVEDFLLSSMRQRAVDPLMQHAAATLRRNFRLSVQQLAAHLRLNERQLLRRFRATFGLGPKHFARIVRMTRALELRRKGELGWAQVASDCGFTDQAHLIRDFNTLAKLAPGTLFRMTSAAAVRPINETLSGSAFSNTFLVR
jgi:AraC-like DNA-binding protein